MEEEEKGVRSMDPSVVRIIAAVVAVVLGVLIFMRRRSRNTE